MTETNYDHYFGSPDKVAKMEEFDSGHVNWHTDYDDIDLRVSGKYVYTGNKGISGFLKWLNQPYEGEQ